MTTLVSEVFSRVRDALGDTNKDRYSDETLLRHLEDGLVEFGLDTRMYKEVYISGLSLGQYIYQLPDDCLQIKSVSFEGEDIPIKSTFQMEVAVGRSWQTDTTESKISAIVVNERNPSEFRVYPVPYIVAESTVEFDPDAYGVIDEVEGYTSDSIYGVEGTILNSDYVVVTDSVYGLIGSMEEAASLIVNYVRHPTIPSTINDTIEISRNFRAALVHYILFKCLSQDLDMTNRQIGTEEYKFYLNYVGKLADVASNGTSTDRHIETTYNGIG